MTEQPTFKAQHNPEDIDSSSLAVHHTIGTFRHQAAGGAHNHSIDDPTSLPLFSELPVDGKDPTAVATLLVQLGVKLTNPPDSTWQNLALLNGWQAYGSGYSTPQYRRLLGGLVLVKGLIRYGALNSVIAVLPVEYAPAKQEIFSAYQSTAGNPVRFDIGPDGTIKEVATTRTATSSWISLQAVYFAG